MLKSTRDKRTRGAEAARRPSQRRRRSRAVPPSNAAKPKTDAAETSAA